MRGKKRLLLLGGGHSHLAVLHELARAPLEDVQATLVTPFPHQTYSGMLPGWLAGHYALGDCNIDLWPLTKRAGVELNLAWANALDANERRVQLHTGEWLDYDLLSLDIGSETQVNGLEACGEALVPVKPLDGFTRAWPLLLHAARQPGYAVAVAGGGAAGVELTLAVREAFRRRELPAAVHLLAPALLSGHAPAVVARVRRRLARAGVTLHAGLARSAPHGLLLDTGESLRVNHVIAATGARPASWLRASGLTLDAAGYVCVNDCHQSVSHRDVFAAGDICARANPDFGRSGVHAVHAGKALAHNLPAMLRQQMLEPYRPRPRSLYLLATGPKHAIASWGDWSAEGRWVWWWKDYIDRGFMRRNRVE